MNSLCRFATTALVALIFTSLAVPNAHVVTIHRVRVGNPGNANDTTNYGAVAEQHWIAKHLVTIQYYTDSLQGMAATNTFSLYIMSMASNLNIVGISRIESAGNTPTA